MIDSNDTLIKIPLAWLNDRRYFFKYVTYQTAAIILENSTLRWSAPTLLNDPFDMSYDLTIDVDLERVGRLVLDQMWEDHFGDNPAPAGNLLGALIYIARKKAQEMKRVVSREDFDIFFQTAVKESLSRIKPGVLFAQNEVRHELQSTKILCLTEQPDNMLMWSHYAEQHKGAVIRFESLPEIDSVFGVAKPILYSEPMPRWMDEAQLVDLLSGRARSDPDEIFQKLILTKSHHWSYEKEWRIYGGKGSSPEGQFEDLKFADMELDSIIFGCRMPSQERANLARMSKNLNPRSRIWEAKPSKTHFKMNIIELSQ